MSFTIVNYGPTPAIITGAVFHLFWTPEEPDPLNPAADALHEFSVWPADIGAEIDTLDDGPLRSIPDNTSKIIRKKFNFMPEGDYVTMRVKKGLVLVTWRLSLDQTGWRSLGKWGSKQSPLRLSNSLKAAAPCAWLRDRSLCGFRVTITASLPSSDVCARER
jgi:hypothetical protein